MATNLPTNISAGQTEHAAIHNATNQAVNSVDVRVTDVETLVNTGRLSPGQIVSTITSTVDERIQNVDLGNTVVAWADVQNKPATFTPTTHSHSVAQVTGLETRLQALEAKILILQPGVPIPDPATVPEGTLVVQLRD